MTPYNPEIGDIVWYAYKGGLYCGRVTGKHCYRDRYPDYQINNAYWIDSREDIDFLRSPQDFTGENKP